MALTTGAGGRVGEAEQLQVLTTQSTLVRKQRHRVRGRCSCDEGLLEMLIALKSIEEADGRSDWVCYHFQLSSQLSHQGVFSKIHKADTTPRVRPLAQTHRMATPEV